MKCKIRVFTGYLWEDAKSFMSSLLFLMLFLAFIFAVAAFLLGAAFAFLYCVIYLFYTIALWSVIGIPQWALMAAISLFAVMLSVFGYRYFRGVYLKTKQDCFDK